MALDHIFTTTFHIHHKYVLDLIGLTHHIPALYNSYRVLTNKDFWNDKNYYKNDISEYMITYSYAYFLYEFFYYLKHKLPLRSPFDIQMFIHAFMSCLGFYYVYDFKKYHFYIAVFLTWEASTPFLNLANVLHRCNLHDTLIYKVNGICFLSMFIVFRIILGSYIFWWFLWSQINIGLRVAGLTLNILNIIWLKNIIKKLC